MCHVARAAALAVASLACTGCLTLPTLWKQGDGQVTTTDAGSCVNLTPENRLHAVAACDRSGTYEIYAMERRVKVAGAVFRATLRERLLQFVRTTSYPWRTLERATVDVWLVAPAFAPEATYLVAAVVGPEGNFAVPLDLEPDLWVVEEGRVLWLGRDTYPTRHAKRAGVLQVTGANHLPAGALARFVALASPARVDDADHVVQLRTRPFAELATARRLVAQRGARFHLANIELVPAAEPEGARAAVFRFPFRD